jgi:hypothetical protein
MLEKYIHADYQDLLATAAKYHDAYCSAAPFPSISFTNFFNEEMLSEVLEEFPDLTKSDNIHFNNPNEIKLASRGEHKFGPKMKAFMHFLNSQTFLEFLQELTNITEPLLPDPYFEGGGCHESKAGGLLKVHADFNKNRLTGLDRRLNVLVYLNKDWKDEYGGHFELWNKDMTKCIKRVRPDFNTLAMFSTTDFSYHGLPDPITCPPDRSRKSLALYYYSNGRPASELTERGAAVTTKFVDRKGNKSEAKMRTFNTVVNVITDITPPILLRTAKKLFVKSV